MSLLAPEFRDTMKGDKCAAESSFVKTRWMVMKIGCIVYVPLPAMLKPFYAKKKQESDNPIEDVLVLFMN
jgi:hypothetical protein